MRLLHICQPVPATLRLLGQIRRDLTAWLNQFDPAPLIPAPPASLRTSRQWRGSPGPYIDAESSDRSECLSGRRHSQ